MIDNNKKIIITEGEFDTNLLKKVLPSIIIDDFKFIPSTGYSSAISKAKSLALRLNKKIVLVLDSDANNKFETEEKKEQIEYIFKSLGREKYVKIFLFMPEIEIVFLESQIMRNKLKQNFPDLNWTDPRVIRNIRNKYKLVDNLTLKEIEELRTKTSIKDLIEILKVIE